MPLLVLIRAVLVMGLFGGFSTVLAVLAMLPIFAVFTGIASAINDFKSLLSTYFVFGLCWGLGLAVWLMLAGRRDEGGLPERSQLRLTATVVIWALFQVQVFQSDGAPDLLLILLTVPVAWALGSSVGDGIRWIVEHDNLAKHLPLGKSERKTILKINGE